MSIVSRFVRPAHRPRSLARAAALAAGLALAGCMAPAQYEPEVSHDIRVDVVTTLHYVQGSAGRPGSGEVARLGTVLAAQGAPDRLHLTLAPLTPAGEAMLPEVETALADFGVRPSAITLSGMVPSGQGDVAVMIERYEASVPGCPDWRRANLIDHSDKNSTNFGCATKQVLAQTIADPRDLARGRPIDAAHGDYVLGAMTRYRTDQIKEFLKQEKEAFGESQGK